MKKAQTLAKRSRVVARHGDGGMSVLYQNGTSYTRVSARHNWDARAPREKARLFQASRKGICAIARASPWTPTTPLLKIFGLAPLSVRFDLKLLLLTHRCVHSIASTLLCSQYNLRTQANSTYRTTRGQTFNSLCLPLVTYSPLW